MLYTFAIDHSNMITYTTTILKFDEKGDKTGWTYITIPADIAEQLIPGNKRAFRVKGFLDKYAFSKVSLLPMGKGDFIMPLNATIRKGIHKGKGAMLKVNIEVDLQPVLLNEDMMQCLHDEPAAIAYFETLPKSHKMYFSNWIESAKTEETKAKRIALTVNACARKMGFGEMIREQKNRL